MRTLLFSLVVGWLACSGSALAQSEQDLNQVRLVRIGDRGDSLRLVVETARAPECQLYFRTRPDRIVLELPNTRLPEGVRRPSPTASWLASSHLEQDNLSRVQWTLNTRHRIPSAQVKTQVLDDPPRVVVDIDPYYQREETFNLSSALKWIRRESAGSDGYLLWNEVAFDPADPGVRVDIGLAQDRLNARETVSSMLRRTGARVGVNGGYFANSGGPLGLVVKEGKILSPHVGRRPPRTALALTRDRQVRFNRLVARGQKLVSREGTAYQDVLLALGGGPQLVRRGQVALTTDEEGLGPRGNDITREAGRTSVASTRDGKMLLVTAAGYRDTHSQGLKLDELAHRLVRRGVTEAMNLDGGASVDMVIGDQVVSAGPGSTTREKPVATALLVFDQAPATYPDRIQLQVDSDHLPADGRSTTRLVARVQDPTGQPVPDGTPIRFWGDQVGLGTFATTTKEGAASVEVRSMRLGTTGLIRVECGSARADQVVRYELGAPRRLYARVVSGRGISPGEQVATLSVQVDDEFGNRLPGIPIACAGQSFVTAPDGSLALELTLPLQGGAVQVESAGLPPVEVAVPRQEPPVVKPSPSPAP